MDCMICQDAVKKHGIKCEGSRLFTLHYSCAAVLIDELLEMDDGEGRQAMRLATKRARRRRGITEE